MRLPSIGLAAALLVGLPLGGHRLVLKLGVRDMYTQKRIVKLTHFKADLYSNYNSEAGHTSDSNNTGQLQEPFHRNNP